MKKITTAHSVLDSAELHKHKAENATRAADELRHATGHTRGITPEPTHQNDGPKTEGHNRVIPRNALFEGGEIS